MSDGGLVLAAQKFAAEVDRFTSELEIINALHAVARHADLNLMGIWFVPESARRGDRKPYEVRFHSSVPDGFLPEWWRLFHQHGRSFVSSLLWQSQVSFTMGEALRALKPTGDDRWSQHLFHRYGMRDAFYVPNGSWVVCFWSTKTIRLDSATRAGLDLAARAASVRLASFSRHGFGLAYQAPNLSARQLSILRLRAEGRTLREAAEHLHIKPSTAEEHQERAIKKLGAKDITHATAEYLRRYGMLAIAAMLMMAAMLSRDPCCWLELIINVGENLPRLA